MSNLSRTKGEEVFENYLNSLNIPFEFEKEHPGKSKRPDYTIEWEGKTIVFDVKDFDPPKVLRTGFGQFDPYPQSGRRLIKDETNLSNTKNIAAASCFITLGHL